MVQSNATKICHNYAFTYNIVEAHHNLHTKYHSNGPHKKRGGDGCAREDLVRKKSSGKKAKGTFCGVRTFLSPFVALS